MSHARELIARRREEALDPGEDLYLREHLSDCADCREFDRAIARTDALIASRPPLPALTPRRPRREPIPARALSAAGLVIVLVVAGLTVGVALRERQRPASEGEPATIGVPVVPDLPPDWTLHTQRGLMYALPTSWAEEPGKPVEMPGPMLAPALHGGTTIGEILMNVRAQTVVAWDRPIEADRPMHLYSVPTRDGDGSLHLLVQLDRDTIANLAILASSSPGGYGPTDVPSALELVGRSLVLLKDATDIGARFTQEQVEEAVRPTVTLGPNPSEIPAPYERVDTFAAYSVNGDKSSSAHIMVFADRAARQRADPNTTRTQSVYWPAPVSFRGVGNVLVMVGSPDVNIRYRVLRALDRLLDPSVVVPPYNAVATPAVATPALPSAPAEARSWRSWVWVYRPADRLDRVGGERGALELDGFVIAPTFSRDGSRFVTTEEGFSEPTLRVIDLASGDTRRLAVPRQLHLYSRVYWLPDDRILITGPAVLVGRPGETAAVIADIFSQASALSPDGAEVALWRYGDDRILIVDLASGAVRASPDRYIRCAEDGVVGITWSPGGSELAVSSCAAEVGLDLTTWFLDARTGQRVRSIPDVNVAAWPQADRLFATVPFPDAEDPEKKPPSVELRLRVIDQAGTVLQELPWGEVSPDGAYLAIREILPAPTESQPDRRIGVAVLYEVATGRSVPVREDIEEVGWTPGGDLYVLGRRGAESD